MPPNALDRSFATTDGAGEDRNVGAVIKMTFRRLEKWVAVAFLLCAPVFLLCAPAAARAATDRDFTAKTTGDLVALCSASADSPVGVAALNFCAGFAEGAVVVELENLAALRAPGLFCLPRPVPSRTKALADFVAWARASPARLDLPVTDGLFGFLSETFPCPAAR